MFNCLTGSKSRRAAWPAVGVAILCASSPAQSNVRTFEGDAYPEEVGWERLPVGANDGERALKNGWFIQTVRLPEGWPGPTGEFQFYRMELDRFVGVDAFFVEWRAITDNPGWLIDPLQVVTVVSAGGESGVVYHTVMTDSAAALSRFYFPRTVAPISPGEPHTYRVEVYPDLYIWYIDGVVAASGLPEGPYPDANAAIVWGAGREYVDATTSWDYVRAGRIPDDASGDFDSDNEADHWDTPFVMECLAREGPDLFGGGPGKNAGPGCAFSDFDGDMDMDLRDFAVFQNVYEED